LLTNAAKFSPAGSPIEVTASSDAQQITVSVRDRGRGIAPDGLGRLFRKFTQLPDEKGKTAPGSGLGLAICRGIVETHGGRIWAESLGIGKGATFTFTVPVAGVAPAPALPVRPPPRQSPQPPVEAASVERPRVDVADRSTHMGRVGRAGERTSIVAVDDEPQVLRFVRRTLEEAGYEVATASDPQEAVKQVELQEPDLVLLDLRLHGLSSLDLLKRIREFTGVPVIFLTGETQREEAVRALRAGAAD